MKGKVKFYNVIKKWGFILGDDGLDYFVHHSQLKKDITLNKEDSVDFIPVESEKGWCAMKVRKL